MPSNFSKEEWLRERIRDRAERQPGLAAWRAAHPLQAEIWLAFCGYADSAFESMLIHRDADTFERSTAAMAELSTWLTNSSPQPGESAEETFRQFLSAGMPAEYAFALTQVRPKKRRGRPVSNRRPVLLAVEQKTLCPQLSWMTLATEYCQCRKRSHDNVRCRDRLRIQAMELDEMLTRLGVQKNHAEFSTQ